MAGQALSLKGCFLARLRTHTCGHNQSFEIALRSGQSADVAEPMRKFKSPTSRSSKRMLCGSRVKWFL